MLKPTLCGCGCLQPLLAGDAVRSGALYNHTAARRLPNTLSYLIEDRGYETPCWIWQGALNKWGYAKLKRSSSTQGAHRLFYRAYVDPDLPSSTAGSDGLDHLCGIRRCVNPAHLQPVTCAENIHRGRVTKLSPVQVRQILSRAVAGENQHRIAAEFGIGQSQVSRIKCGLRWSASMMT